MSHGHDGGELQSNPAGGFERHVCRGNVADIQKVSFQTGKERCAPPKT